MNWSSTPNVQTLPKPHADLRELALAAMAPPYPNDDVRVLADILLERGLIPPYKKPPGAGGGAANTARFRRYGLEHANREALAWAVARFGAKPRFLDHEGIFGIEVIDARVKMSTRTGQNVVICEFIPLTWAPRIVDGPDAYIVPTTRGLKLGQVHTYVDRGIHPSSFVRATFRMLSPGVMAFDRDLAMGLTKLSARRVRLRSGRDFLATTWS